MSSKQVNFTTEIITETLKVKWKITNFKRMQNWATLRDTLFIEVDTGSSANLEAKWIIGFTSVKDASSSAYGGCTQHIYCKPIKFPGNLQKVLATLSVKSDLGQNLLYGVRMGSTQISQCLTLNEQMVAGCGSLHTYLDNEGSLVLNIELTVMMPQSVKTKHTPCLPD